MKHLFTYTLVSIFWCWFSMLVLAQDAKIPTKNQYEKQPIASITMSTGDVFIKRQLEKMDSRYNW